MKKQYRFTFQLNGAIKGNMRGEIDTLKDIISLESTTPNTTINGLIYAKCHRDAVELFKEFKICNCIKGRMLRIVLFVDRRYALVVKKANTYDNHPVYEDFIYNPSVRKKDIQEWYEDESNHPQDCEYFVVKIIDSRGDVICHFERRKGNKMADKYIIGSLSNFKSKY